MKLYAGIWDSSSARNIRSFLLLRIFLQLPCDRVFREALPRHKPLDELYDAFVSLLKDKPLNKITVKEICGLAEINRATFYKYYSDPFDLLDKMEQEILSKLRQSLRTSPGSFREIFIFIMTNIRAEGERYRTLFSENGDSKFPGRIFSLYYDHIAKDLSEQFPKLSPARREWLYLFYRPGVLRNPGAVDL